MSQVVFPTRRGHNARVAELRRREQELAFVVETTDEELRQARAKLERTRCELVEAGERVAWQS